MIDDEMISQIYLSCSVVSESLIVCIKSYFMVKLSISQSQKVMQLFTSDDIKRCQKQVLKSYGTGSEVIRNISVP